MNDDFVMEVIRGISGRNRSGYNLTLEAEIVLYAIGHGWRLQIPKNVAAPTAHASLVQGYPVIEQIRRPPISVPRNVAEELLRTNLLHLLSKERQDTRIGWKECGLNGEAADFYCMSM